MLCYASSHFHLSLCLCRFIDIDKVTLVNEVDASQQDRNNGSFRIHCEGRIYDLQAQNNADMKK